MRRRTIWTGAILAIVACALGAFYYFANAFDPCDTVVKNVAKSPDSKKQVVMFERECGATAGFNTQASVAPIGRSFSADRNPAFFVVAGRHNLNIAWIGNAIVEIAIPQGEKVYKSEASADDVAIRYK